MHVYANGDVFVGGLVDGPWGGLVDGKREGHGLMKHVNGDRYNGNFKHDLEDGYGVYVWANGDVYDGHWKGGNRHGKGRLVWHDGDEYDGDWKDDMKHGKGKYRFVCKDREEHKQGFRVYVGQWEKDEKCGFGIANYADDDKYEGNWRGDVHHGHGKFTFGDKTSIEGEFQDSYPHGKCRQTFENGDVYVGRWQINKKHGKGTLTTPTGEVYDQLYKQDRLAGSMKRINVANESRSRGERAKERERQALALPDAPVRDGGGEGVSAGRLPSTKRSADASAGEAPLKRGGEKRTKRPNGYAAFNLFFADLRVRQKAMSGGPLKGETNEHPKAAAGAAWRKLSAGEKEVYMRRAKEMYMMKAEEMKRREASFEQQGGVTDRGNGELGGGRDEGRVGEQQQPVRVGREQNGTTNPAVYIAVKEGNESEIRADVPGSCGVGQAATSLADDTNKPAAAVNPGQSTNRGDVDAEAGAEGGSQGQRQQPTRARQQQHGTSHCQTPQSVIDVAVEGGERSRPRVVVPGSCGAGRAASPRADDAHGPPPAANPEKSATASSSSSTATTMSDVELGRLYQTIKEKLTGSESIHERKFYSHLKSYCSRKMRGGVLLSCPDVDKINNLMGRFESNMRLLNDKGNDIEDIYVYEGFVAYIIKECERELPVS